MTSGQEIYVSVDIEASGPFPPTYSMLSIGACLVDNPDLTFYLELQPMGSVAVPEALAVVGKNMKHFQEKGQAPETVMTAFDAWIAGAAVGAKPVFVGFNAAFDWSFVNYYFHSYLNRNPFGIAPIDIKAYFMGLMGTNWENTRSSRIPARFKGTPPQTHNALDDARSQAEMFRKMLLHREERQ